MTITGACDGRSWKPHEVECGPEGFLSIWVEGLPENADRHNIQARLGGTKLAIQDVTAEQGRAARQLNAVVTRPLAAGEQGLVVSIGETRSAPVSILVKHA